MTLFLQYNVNNHIPDGAHYIRWPIVFPIGAGISVRTVLNKNLLNFEPLLGNAGYTLAISH